MLKLRQNDPHVADKIYNAIYLYNKSLYCNSNFTEICSNDLINDITTRRQAIFWTNG